MPKHNAQCHTKVAKIEHIYQIAKWHFIRNLWPALRLSGDNIPRRIRLLRARTVRCRGSRQQLPRRQQAWGQLDPGYRGLRKSHRPKYWEGQQTRRKAAVVERCEWCVAFQIFLVTFDKILVMSQYKYLSIAYTGFTTWLRSLMAKTWLRLPLTGVWNWNQKAVCKLL